jgi:KUP system potassium uptake protein
MPNAAVQTSTSPGKTPVALAGLTALGIVYGDLGTSPLYTFQTIVQVTGSHLSAAGALGILSLLFWTLIITISVKYCAFVMRADNHGEGGILALMSLVGANDWRKGTYIGAAMGLLGAALIYGDGVITPAISVLSALEGVNVATSALKPYIVPIALAVLISLFSVQQFGTARIGALFGPVMLVWFLTIGGLGLVSVLHHPGVLAAVNPVYGVSFLLRHKPVALLILGGVFLCATGGEALYADMGHIGRFPIRLAWYVIVLPALLLSYAGQTALLLDKGVSGANPFFALAPPWAVIPLVMLATLATIIASQAIITGAFSMTRQAIQLGWLPMFDIRQTSQKSYGQIYVPAVNWMMAAATIAITLAFRSSDKLAGAYGTAVSTTMLLTTLLLYRAMHRIWKWPQPLVLLITGLFLIVDISFFTANLTKLLQGGWIPLSLGLCIFTVMLTWKRGAQAIRRKLNDRAETVDRFMQQLAQDNIPRTPGVAVFLTHLPDQIPPIILDFVRTVGSLRETVIALSLHFEEQPQVSPQDRGHYEKLADGLWRVTLNYGFSERPDLSAALAELDGFGDKVDLSAAAFYGNRDFVIRDSKSPTLSRWRTALFAYLFRNGARMTDRFNLPADRTIELARQIEI